jgi:hypothetical protein
MVSKDEQTGEKRLGQLEVKDSLLNGGDPAANLPGKSLVFQ